MKEQKAAAAAPHAAAVVHHVAPVAPPPPAAPVAPPATSDSSPKNSGLLPSDVIDRLSGMIESACKKCVKLPPPPPAAVDEAAWHMRGNQSMLHKYVNLAMSDDINGFMNFPTVAAFAVIASAQQSAGVTGSVGEIGVHHGRSFILSALLSAPAERLWMLDLFQELQRLNVDHSGSGSFHAVARNLEKVGLDIKDVAVVTSSSLDVTNAAFCEAQLPLFRWFSVDGGHTDAITRYDMHLGACHLAQGGVLVVDDIFNNLFLGVTEGIFNFVSLNRDRVAPFFIITGKIYMTTPSHHQRYLSAVANWFESRYGAYQDPEKAVIAGWNVLSHSVPVHADIVSEPGREARVNSELDEILARAYAFEQSSARRDPAKAAPKSK
jgi:hypothetical protein